MDDVWKKELEKKKKRNKIRMKSKSIKNESNKRNIFNKTKKVKVLQNIR
jgi:hypothetical protein